MLRKLFSDMAWLGGQKFSGWDKFFLAQTLKKFYPRIKIFRGIIFFLDRASVTYSN